MRATPIVLAALALAAPAAAQDRACVTRVNHLDIAIAPGAILDDPDVSLRERLLGWPSGLWNRAWGNPVACDSATTIAYLGGILALDEIDGYCLSEAPDDEGWLLVPGERNFRGRCRVTICDRVNNTAADGAAVARAVTSLATGQQVDDFDDGVRAVASTSGAMMLTGQSSLLMSLLGQGAGAVGAALATPAAAGAAAVTVMAVGGAVYVCRE